MSDIQTLFVMVVILTVVILTLIVHVGCINKRLQLVQNLSTECAPNQCDCGHVFTHEDIDGGRCTSCLTMVLANLSTECVSAHNKALICESIDATEEESDRGHAVLIESMTDKQAT